MFRIVEEVLIARLRRRETGRFLYILYDNFLGEYIYKGELKMRKPESLERVHTHTHTHTQVVLRKS